MQFGPPDPLTELVELRQVRLIPILLGGFLAVLAVGAVGHALATAVRRRAHDLAVLRALGMTQWQCRWTVATHASVLAVVGLFFGVPLGLALGRSVWRAVADYTPLQYVPPLAAWALLLIGPATLIVANALAVWPGRRAAMLHIASILGLSDRLTESTARRPPLLGEAAAQRTDQTAVIRTTAHAAVAAQRDHAAVAALRDHAAQRLYRLCRD